MKTMTKTLLPIGNRSARRRIERLRRKYRRITIVGAGIAGLYQALRYLQNGYDVILYDAQMRVGGRLDSISVPGVGAVLEGGAMRYTTADKLLVSLIDELDLETVPFAPPTAYYLRNTPVPVGAVAATSYSTRNTLLLVGVGSTTSAMPPRDSLEGKVLLPYTLPAELEGLEIRPDVLINYAMVRFLKELTFEKLRRGDVQLEGDLLGKIATLQAHTPNWQVLTKGDWRHINQYGAWNGEAIYKLGFQNILSHYLGLDGEKYVIASLGYDTVPGNWSAAAALEWFAQDFSPDTEYRMIVGGFRKLIQELVKRIANLGGRINRGWRLTSLTSIEGGEPDGEGNGTRWRLGFLVGENDDVRTVLADRVVLAMPPGPLEGLQVKHREWEAFRQEHLSAVEKRNLLKVFLVYPEAWWEGLNLPGATTARLYTNYHLRGIYYYGPDWLSTYSDYQRVQRNANHAVLMVYTDGEHVDFFAPALRRGEDTGVPHFHNPVGQNGQKALTPLEEYEMIPTLIERGTSKRLIDKIHGELEQIHGLPDGSIPQPFFGLQADWAGNPYERSGWHNWRHGVRPWYVAQRMLAPITNGNLSIIGEAFSMTQGWIEGALKSAELDLAHYTDFGKPIWLAMTEAEYADYISP